MAPKWFDHWATWAGPSHQQRYTFTHALGRDLSPTGSQPGRGIPSKGNYRISGGLG